MSARSWSAMDPAARPWRPLARTAPPQYSPHTASSTNSFIPDQSRRTAEWRKTPSSLERSSSHLATMAARLFVALALLGCSWGFLLDDNSLQNLLNLITIEKKNRAALANEITALKTEIDAMRARHQASLCKCPATGVVAFSATLTKDITNFGTQQPLVYDKVITNVGGAYDARHGHFRAPVSGVYKFSFSVLQGTASMWIGLELVREGTVIGRIKTGDNGYYNMGTNIINAHVNQGEDVWVRHMSDSDTKKVISGGGEFTMFSGHLVQAD